MTAGEERPPSVSAGPRGLPIRRRSETDGCGCLDCRNVDATATRRSLLDTVAWSWRLCRTHPSILVLGAVLVALGTLVDVLGVRYLPVPVADVLEIAVAGGFFIGVRIYVATLTARELTGDTVSPWLWCRRAVGRALVLVVVLIGLLGALSALSTLLSVALMGVLVLTALQPTTPYGYMLVFAVSVGLLLLPVGIMLFKCWFAMEACILGRYGPLESIRVSWAMTTSYRWKLARLLSLFTVAIGLSYVGRLVAPGSGPLAALFPAVQSLAGALAELSAVVWFAVSAHLYVQSVVEG
ncbi:hypothetical protein NDI56_00805 [Haloarcula sp. S1CR25-12]|uniref:DUF4013 domain-containing protein n=1 Tax=Haloarcula saliterrae TaxID=2950534 RepID=A0ABU2F6P7_9EURY|nr:hypothetical protein [Haloarcula sp. S1CR25-12]MDS0257942.1 hypothetical protein [Haloarcula sp. S1CR25-12]